jgi:hypothetical protein
VISSASINYFSKRSDPQFRKLITAAMETTFTHHTAVYDLSLKMVDSTSKPDFTVI